MHIRKIVSFVCILALSQAAWGQIKLPAIFSDNMVLQQQAQVPFWGTSTPGHTVQITPSWDQHQYTVKADASGNWRLRIQTPAAGGPYTIRLKDEQTLSLRNVLVGEVWVCSGQSNMERPMQGVTNQPVLNSNEILLHARDSALRLFHVERKVALDPQQDCAGSWAVSNAENARTFSAVGYQFAKKMQDLLGVPVGIIEAAWGGTPIEGWMDPESWRAFDGKVAVPASSNPPKANPHLPSCLYNGMINPIAGYGIKGFLWYQGENNRRNPSWYRSMMAAMVKGWRQQWDQAELPFYYVQIAPYDYGKSRDSVPYLREAQTQAMSVIPHSGMVVSVDVGNKYSIHPADKTTIANRLLYWALGDTYHWKGIAYHSPQYKGMLIKAGQVTLVFDHAPLGLTSFDQPIMGFELAGADRKFYPAEAHIQSKSRVVLQSKDVPDPVAVRYLFKDWNPGNLFSTSGLPVTPFRTDHW